MLNKSALRLRAFQSTLPHGSDIFDRPRGGLFLHFNPRSLTGATLKVRRLKMSVIISIHAPSRERHISLLNKLMKLSYFNPRSLTGATGQGDKVIILHKYFNPRSLTGATITGASQSTISNNFNPRSLTGATLLPFRQIIILVFQSTLPHGSDGNKNTSRVGILISIHAPSRERRW